MQQIKTVIADDEPLAISNLKAKLATYPNIQIEACFDNGDEVLAYLQHNTVDLVFLDIQMPGIKGIEVLKQLNKSSAMAAPLIILVTAYDNYAFSAYEHLRLITCSNLYHANAWLKPCWMPKQLWTNNRTCLFPRPKANSLLKPAPQLYCSMILIF